MDDGPGIAVDDIERIFDPFYTRREGGSGMGLAIAHRAVQAHGGALLVSSRKGQGATFAVILPRRNWRERQEMEEQGWTAPAETRGPNRDE
jgi:signal transduction histidine kinase